MKALYDTVIPETEIEPSWLPSWLILTTTPMLVLRSRVAAVTPSSLTYSQFGRQDVEAITARCCGGGEPGKLDSNSRYITFGSRDSCDI